MMILYGIGAILCFIGAFLILKHCNIKYGFNVNQAVSCVNDWNEYLKHKELAEKYYKSYKWKESNLNNTTRAKVARRLSEVT